MSRSPFFTALFHPVNLSMLGLIVVAGLCSAWWLAPIGFVLWLIMVIAIARDPGLQMTFTHQNRQPLAQRFQTRFDQLDRSRFSIYNAIERSGAPIRTVATPLTAALDELVEHAYQLCLRLSAIDNNYAVQSLTNNFDEDIAKMQKSIAETTDPASRKEFEATIQSLKNSQAQLKAVNTLLSRFEAQLTGTASAVDGVVTGVVGLQGLNAKQTQERIPALIQILQTEQEELKQFDAELEKSAAL